MKVSPNFLSQLQSYLDGNVDLKSFRDWQLSLLLEREQFNKSDQDFLFAVEGIYAEFLAGVPEQDIQESLASLVPPAPNSAPIRYESESWSKTSVSFTFLDPLQSGSSAALVGGSGAKTIPIFVEAKPACV
jgi:hypothetical protein